MSVSKIFLLTAAILCLTSFPKSGDAEESHRYFFGFGKSRISDAVPMKQRGHDAVQSVNDSLARLDFITGTLQEPVRDYEDYVTNPAPFVVTSERVKAELESWRNRLNEEDVIIIYSHTHGLKGRGGEPGGLGLDDRGLETARQRSYLNWPDYAEQLLKLPAKTVVVLTMACHSGGLVEYLNSNEQIKSLWQDRKESGRDFLVITSQNSEALSNPRWIEGEVINPFTYAVIKAFQGAADGYGQGKPDGKITLGELADCIIEKTRNHTRTGDEANDPDPQLTGSFHTDTVIASLPDR